MDETGTLKISLSISSDGHVGRQTYIVLGGWFYSKSEEDLYKYDVITRNYIQTFDLGTKVWEFGSSNMLYRRSDFAAVGVNLN